MKKITNITLVFAGICLLNLVYNPLLSQDNQGFQDSDFNGEPLEEVRLQTDRDLYLAGESIWFSSFCSIKNVSTPSPISQILYVEIYNSGHKVFLREKFKLNGGKAAGHLVIPEETPTGYYFIRAYTMYLRNFPPENYYISSLTIINPEIPQSGGNVNKEIKMGGNLINDIPSQVALKIPREIVNKTITAYLANTKGEQLNQLKIYPNGLCMIAFTPSDSIGYFLKFQFNNGDSLLTPLPESQKTGISVQTEISGKELSVKTYWPEFDQKNSSNYKLKVLTKAYHQKYETEVMLNQNMTETMIPLAKLPQGLSYVVVANQNDSILCFNPVYLEKEIPSTIQIRLQKNTFSTREKVELVIQSPESQVDDLEMMSVSVVKKGTAITMGELLPEDVIENPCLLESYLVKNGGRTPDLMDQITIALILHSPNALNSYRKHLDQQGSDRIYLPEIRDVSISGFLLDKKTGEPLKDVQMFASVLFEDFQLHTTKTMDDGSFVFTLNHLTGKHNLYLFPDIHDSGEHELLIHNDFSTQFRDLNECYPVIDSGFLGLLEEIYINQQISANFPGGVSADLHEVQRLSPWFGVEMISIKLADYIDLTSFREVINEIVPSVRLRVNNGQYRLTVFDNNSQMAYENPLVLLDHIPVTDINELVKIHPALIEKIEVMNQPYILGNYTIWGLILITTKTDDFAGIKLPEESAFLNYQTLKNNSSFVPLKFENEIRATGSIPFFNTVLYWEPFYENGSTDKKISFYTSDHAADYNVIIRGIKRNGSSIAGTANFSVTDK